MVPDIDGPTHKYLGASPGCWKLYGDVLAKEYSDIEYMKVHRLTVDAYSLQHVGTESPQTIQSMNVHLIALCAAVQHGIVHDAISKIMDRCVRSRMSDFFWLTPPASFGTITVVDVLKAETQKEHAACVEAWAKDVWNAWGGHHKTVEGYLEGVI